MHCAGVVLLFFSIAIQAYANQETIKIALNYPQTGPYAKEGKDQWYAAEIARKEINDAGGILGKQISYRWSNSESNPGKTKANLSAAISRDKVKMAFGGSSSAVAIAEVAEIAHKIPGGLRHFSDFRIRCQPDAWLAVDG